MRQLLLPMILSLGFAFMAAADEPAWEERQVGDLTVHLPTGGGWKLVPYEDGTFMAVQADRTASGAPVLVRAISVYPNKVGAFFSDWLPVEVATDYLLWEIRNMKTEGVEKGIYSLSEIDVFQVTRSGRELHVLRNIKEFHKPPHPGQELEVQELYLVFPEDFSTSLTFYKIFISADCLFPECKVEDLGLSAMYPALDGLGFISETR